ncbi:MAG: hypothetical protein ABSA18_05160 [Dehalococcoidia bacterium]|jgi:hypothetical protein
MKKVVIGGSRAISFLIQPLRELIDTLVNDNDIILVGDANGADKASQRYLHEKRYENVIVYCMNSSCRNNIGQWPVKNIVTSHKKKDAKYFGTKDLHMAREADLGIMIWDGESKGTFRNVINLLDDKKSIYVCYQPHKQISLITSSKDLNSLIRDNESKNAEVFKNELEKRLQMPEITLDTELNTPEKASIQGALFSDYEFA